MLQQKVRNLMEQKRELQVRGVTVVTPEQIKYRQVMAQKIALEAKVRDSEASMNELRKEMMTGGTWSSDKKDLIRSIVRADAENAQIREQINNLRQDINILQDQVNKLQNKQH